ncbi:GIY-YIG nuclease family protein [Marinobacterium sp. A346]|uniref:GIY-YIG nuclease family protein n=2 Tax=Marinobacterium weihaiense TaxID=2851016 RepID=A0ABS6M956_9GAMM|nr:GIY-YIG nuclease family protein [Marinobacterium weihaiense]
MLRCADGSLYTGVTTDPRRRLAEHNGEGGSPRGARYTRARRPVELAWVEGGHDRRSALQREWALKRLKRDQKERLISKMYP